MTTEQKDIGTPIRPLTSDAAGAPGTAPPQVTMGLLDYVTAHSMDEDYAHVAQRHEEQGESRRARAGVAALIMLGLFGLLVATAAVQTSRNAVAAENGRESLVTQIKARSAQVGAKRDRIVDLRKQIDSLQAEYLDATAQGRSLSTRLSRLGVQTGAVAVTGPGVKVVVDDAPDAVSTEERVLDKDLQKLVNGLWASGAEAISINGQRLSNLTAIRHAGTSITVNWRGLSRPYVVSAIGNPDTLPARFVDTEGGSYWLDIQAGYGLQFDMTSEESLRLPAVNQLDLNHASLQESDR